VSAAKVDAQADYRRYGYLPAWVERGKENNVLQWLREASESGGFLVIVGDSSVGKTRLLYETVLDVLPDWFVLVPDLGEGDVVNAVADSTFRLPKLVVWLDELQRFLPGPYLTEGSTAVTPGAVRRLLDAPTPVVIVGTLWPEHSADLRGLEARSEHMASVPLFRFPRAADILTSDRLREITLRSFSRDERKMAALLASEDPRLADAVAVQDFGITEVLSGAPELIRRYERANADQRALLLGAIDARRLGLQSALTESLLLALGLAYLDYRPTDTGWFEAALDELKRTSLATAPLVQVAHPDARMAGYTVADYLLQHAIAERRNEKVAAPVWEALVEGGTEAADAYRLGLSAENRLLYSYAIPLYRRAAVHGEELAAGPLALLLAARAELDVVVEQSVASAKAGDEGAGLLAELLTARGDIEALTARADGGDDRAAETLAELLAARGDIEALAARADAGDNKAADTLANLLAARGDIEALTARADAGDNRAAFRLADLLAARGDIEPLTTRADAGGFPAAYTLANLLAARGDIEALTARADAGDNKAADTLANLLIARGDIEALTARADASDDRAADRLANLLIARGDIEALTARADASDDKAADTLANLLAARGDIEALTARADAGDDDRAAETLAELLAARGDIEALTARADASDYDAADTLPNLLIARGDIEALTTRADAGDYDAARTLAGLLAAREDIKALTARADAGDDRAAETLANLLAARGDIEALTARADAGDYDAARTLADLLAAREDIDTLRARTQAGDRSAARILARLLAARGDLNGVRQLVDAGQRTAGRLLIGLYIQRGQIVKAESLRTLGLRADESIAEILSD